MLSDQELALADQMMSLMQQAMYSLPGADSRDLSAAWIPDGEDKYVLAIYINNYSESGSALGDAVPEKVTQMTNKINELFGSQVMDPNEGGSVAEPMPMEEGTASEKTADVPMEQEIIGGADGPAATFTATEADAMEKTVNEAMNSETKETEEKGEE